MTDDRASRRETTLLLERLGDELLDARDVFITKARSELHLPLLSERPSGTEAVEELLTKVRLAANPFGWGHVDTPSDRPLRRWRLGGATAGAGELFLVP